MKLVQLGDRVVLKQMEAEDAEMKASQESVEPNTGEVVGQEVTPKKRTRRTRKERTNE